MSSGLKARDMGKEILFIFHNKKYSMKRITSLDFLRGFAVFVMTVFHVFLDNWEHMSGSGNFFALPTGLMITGIIIFFFMHWRDFFIMISAIVHWYSMSQAYLSGKSPKEILKKQLIFGVILYLFGMFRNAFLNQWGIIDRWYRRGEWLWGELKFVYFFDALNIIAVGVIFSAIVFFIITATKNWNKTKTILISFAIGTAFFYFLTPLMVKWVSAWAGVPDLRSYVDFYIIIPPEQWFTRFIQVMLIGREAPLFPTLGVVCMGMAIGYLLVTDKLSIKRIRYFYLVGLGMIIIGVLFLILFEGGFANILSNLFFHVEPVWFVCVNSALQMMVIVTVIRWIEFNPKLKINRWLMGSRFFRRWSMVALTVFAFQVFALVPTALLNWITVFEYQVRNSATAAQTLLLAVVTILLWDILIRIWEKLKFIGTWEWLILLFGSLIGRRPIDWKDPLRIRPILYEVDTVNVVPKNESIPESPVT